MINDTLKNEAIRYSHAKSITEAVKVALMEYIASKKLKELSEGIKNQPLEFKHTAKELRSLNRK